MSAAKMVADSTISDLPEKTRKRKKVVQKKRTKKKGEKKSKKKSSEDEFDDFDLDLENDIRPIGDYIKNREALLEQMFHCVRGASLQRALPEVLKELSHQDLKKRCLEQLEVMSKKRIRRIFAGDDPATISSSGTEDDTSDDQMEPEEGELGYDDQGVVDSTSQYTQGLGESDRELGEHEEGSLGQHSHSPTPSEEYQHMEVATDQNPDHALVDEAKQDNTEEVVKEDPEEGEVIDDDEQSEVTQICPERESTPSVPERESTPSVPERESTPSVPERENTPSVPERECTPSDLEMESTPSGIGNRESTLAEDKLEDSAAVELIDKAKNEGSKDIEQSNELDDIKNNKESNVSNDMDKENKDSDKSTQSKAILNANDKSTAEMKQTDVQCKETNEDSDLNKLSKQDIKTENKEVDELEHECEPINTKLEEDVDEVNKDNVKVNVTVKSMEAAEPDFVTNEDDSNDNEEDNDSVDDNDKHESSSDEPNVSSPNIVDGENKEKQTKPRRVVMAPKIPVLTKNQMELLELEMRARAIKAMLKKSK